MRLQAQVMTWGDGMNVFVYNDGSVIVFAPGEEINAPLENLWICISDPQTGDTLMIENNIWVNKHN